MIMAVETTKYVAAHTLISAMLRFIEPRCVYGMDVCTPTPELSYLTNTLPASQRELAFSEKMPILLISILPLRSLHI